MRKLLMRILNPIYTTTTSFMGHIIVTTYIGTSKDSCTEFHNPEVEEIKKCKLEQKAHAIKTRKLLYL